MPYHWFLCGGGGLCTASSSAPCLQLSQPCANLKQVISQKHHWKKSPRHYPCLKDLSNNRGRVRPTRQQPLLRGLSSLVTLVLPMKSTTLTWLSPEERWTINLWEMAGKPRPSSLLVFADSARWLACIFVPEDDKGSQTVLLLDTIKSEEAPPPSPTSLLKAAD